jgi:murein DD-endopeptidase MepM/ murein hydrolase activator NlpD
MRPPLDKMKIRTAEHDQFARGPGVTSRLSTAASPIGGSFGRVRSSGARPHQGWDLYAPVGTPVHAVTAGVVEYSETRGDYGTQVCIRLDDSALSPVRREPVPPRYAFYAHLSASFVRSGQAVLEGDEIGLTGTSGNAGNTPPHLHFELRTNPRPSSGLSDRLDPGELLGYGYYSSE